MNLGTWVFGLIALASLGSVVARRPWTARVARRHNPPEVWETDLFRETNMLLSSGWTLLFAASAALAAVAPMWLSLTWGGVLTLLGHYSPKLGAWYASRRLRAMGILPDAAETQDEAP